MRHQTKIVRIGNKIIGGDNPVLIQSMTNTKTEDIKATIKQIKELEDVGCDIVRVAIPTEKAAKALENIKKEVNIPIVADIHFDYRLALLAIKYGADKIRINPGNIGSNERVKEIIQLAKKNNIPIRVGVNGGSLEKKYLNKYKKICAKALVESALDKVRLIESMEYDNLVVSIKSSNVLMSIEAYELISKQVNYPLHVGITEAGTLLTGTIKSSVGLGIILYKGIGDTIRVSLTSNPVEEICVAKKILKSLSLTTKGVEVISCPTCGRTNINVIELANQVERMVEKIEKNITVAVMGCAVNGPGEAKEADIGIAGGKGEGLIFKKGQILKKVNESELLSVLKEEINKL